MKQPTTRKLLSYWDDLRADRMAPERDDIDPTAIPGLLLDTFILEVDPKRELPIRVAGARMTSLFARELKGASFAQLFLDDDRETLAALVRSVLDDPTPAVAGITTAPAGRSPLELELLLLPLRHRGKTHARILGSLTPASNPAWLGLIETAPLGIASIRIIPSYSLRESPQTLDIAPPFKGGGLPANNNRGGEPVLRVVKGGRGT